MVNGKKLLIWLLLEKSSLLQILFRLKEGRHVAKILKESGLTQTHLVLNHRYSDHFVQEVDQRHYKFTGLFVHDLEQPPNLESCNVNHIEGVTIFCSFAIYLFPYEMLRFYIIFLT